MSHRHQILDDSDFWTRLEYDASRWLENSDDHSLRRFWIDGFLPERVMNTARGAIVEGTVWVGDGPRTQHPYRFVVSVPQKMLHRRRQTISVQQFVLDKPQQTLQIEVTIEKQAA